MNSDDRLECLRLAIEFSKREDYGVINVIEAAELFFDWIYEHENPNSLTFEKINPDRKEK